VGQVPANPITPVQVIQKYPDKIHSPLPEKEIKPEKHEKKRKKARKWEADHPKKPCGPFFCYQQVRRPLIRNEYPNLCTKQIVAKMSQEWRTLSNEERAPYEKLAKRNRDKYEEEMKRYKAAKKKI